jgi:hypothetical protein
LAINVALALDAHAQTGQGLSFVWNPSSSPGIAGYALYYGIVSRAYNVRVDAGTNTTVVVNGLTPGTAYYFVVSAYDANGSESVPSNELSCSIPAASFNHPPTLDRLGGLTLDENAGPQSVNLSGITSGVTNGASALTVTATSMNPQLIPSPILNYTSPDTTGTLSFAPATNQYGSGAVAVTVNNGRAISNTITRALGVTVRPTQAQLSLGSTVLRAGQNGSVPVVFSSSSGMTDIEVVLKMEVGRLSNFSVTALTPELTKGTVDVISQDPSTWLLHMRAGQGQIILGSNQISRLNFTANPGQRSVAVPLDLMPFGATRTDGVFLTNRPVQSGRVVIVGEEALLEVSRGPTSTRNLVLYGKPSVSYLVEYTTNLSNPSWGALATIVLPSTMTASVSGINAQPEEIFCRAVELP